MTADPKTETNREPCPGPGWETNPDGITWRYTGRGPGQPKEAPIRATG